jgi:sterol O-acyltransferase
MDEERETRIAPFLPQVLTFFGLFSVLHVLTVDYIEPILSASHRTNLIITIFDLVVPFLVGHVLIFYMVFDVAPNTLAELTFFGDRHFYDDWWNR